MQNEHLSRRGMLGRAGLLVGAALAGQRPGRAEERPAGGAIRRPPPFRFCLNTATIRGQRLGLAREIEVAAEAGYNALEPWVSSIEEFAQTGGSLPDLKKRLTDLGLSVESAIGFPEWVVDDDARRAKGLERAKYEMDLVARLGGKRLAAPPVGATNPPKLDWLRMVERYRALLEAGDGIGVTPQLELWGFSQNLSRLGECVGVALETAHPRACVLADVFHLYKGGSDFHGMRLLGPDTLQVLHMNDYPSEPPREKIDDSFRVYPGDGIAPLAELLGVLKRTGGQKVLSLEVFNRQYWSQDALAVAKAGLAKLKQAAQRAA